MTGTARELLTWAAHQVGTREKPSGSNKQQFAGIAGHANGQAWCATFIVAGWKANDVPIVRGTNSARCSTMHEAFKEAGRLFQQPRAGDAGYKFIVSENRIGHVFFVEKVVGDFVQTIEGNTNLDGSATGIGVFRLRRRWRNGPTSIHGFGRPNYDAEKTQALTKTVSLANVIDAAKLDPPAAQGATSHPEDVKIVEAALMAEGLLSPAFAKDGSFGTVSLTAYAQWQKLQGFTGVDADGVPGKDTLKALGGRHGFRVTD